jgi:diguanylate cyclase (GGDEF)-like protein
VDHFKNYNDTYGHQQGDVALQTVAKILASMFRRPGDFLARWGGEEFAALLSNTDLHGGSKVGEEIRANVENAVILCADGASTKVTVSVGVNAQTPTQDSSVNAFISGADKALYAAKNAGRNRVCLHDGAAAPS